MQYSKVITSLQNPHIKRLVGLRNRRMRDTEGVFLIEGARELSRAAAAGVRLQDVYLCPELFSPEAKALAPEQFAAVSIQLSRTAFEKASLRENPDGVLGVAYAMENKLPQPSDQALVVVLSGLEKPGNIGAILRTADSAGADAVLVVGDGADPFSPNVIRSSQGSIFSLPVIRMNNEEAINWLGSENFKIVACTPESGVNYWDSVLSGRIALLLGAEHSGLPTQWRELHSVRIPMHGKADSLNVATAAALVLYEVVRQRHGNKSIISGA